MPSSSISLAVQMESLCGRSSSIEEDWMALMSLTRYWAKVAEVSWPGMRTLMLCTSESGRNTLPTSSMIDVLSLAGVLT